VFGQIIITTTLSKAADNRVTITQMLVFIGFAVVVLALTRARLSYKPNPALRTVPSAT
jgi:hypothetical protein